MNLIDKREIWICPAMEARGLPSSDDEISYLVRVPTYYGMTAYRDRFARTYGPTPRQVDLLGDLVNGLEAIEPDAAKRSTLASILARARLDPVRLSLLEPAEIETLALAEDAALRVCEPYRLRRARIATHAELHVIEGVREHVADWRGMVDADGVEVRPDFETTADGRQILSVAAVERVPEHHLAYLSRRIDALERPTGQAVKNSSSRPSGTTTPKTSKAAANSHRSTRRKAASVGKSLTSQTRRGAKSA
jgi:hypothetical protein